MNDPAGRNGLPAPMMGVRAAGRKITQTLWGQAWCDNLERHGDFANRLPRGRTYLRRGSVRHLEIHRGRISAVVQGKALYKQEVGIQPLDPEQIDALTELCRGKIHAALDLVRGNLPKPILAKLREPGGLLPQPGHITMSCSCPDWAHLCKHLAAVLYGVGVRLDESPDLLFKLRGVEPDALVRALPSILDGDAAPPGRRLKRTDLASLFDLELEEGPLPRPATRRKTRADSESRRADSGSGPRSSSPRPDASKMEPRSDLPSSVSRQSLLGWGLTSKDIARMLRRSELTGGLQRGVYHVLPEGRRRIEELIARAEDPERPA